MVGGRSPGIVLVAVAALLAVTACATTGDVSGGGAPPDPASEPTTDELNRLLERAAQSLGLGNHAEALHDFVVLTLIAQHSDQGRRAASELERLSSGLLLEPSSPWLAPDGSQASASTRQLKSSGTPLPSVIVTISEGPARVAVHALMIQFTVTEGGVRKPSMLVPTSEFGTATAPIHSEVDGTGAISVSATPVVVTDYGQVALSGEPLVFIYDPPASVFVALTATLVQNEFEAAPELADVVAARLRPIGSVSVLDGSAVDGFVRAYSGDPDAIRRILNASDAALLGVAVLEVLGISQVKYGGRVYDIWKADAVVRFLLFDSVGGRSLITLSSEPIAGQGGNRTDALVDIARVGAQALESLIGSAGDELQTVVTGSRE
ncbi:MAG: hypothetical protein V3S41_01750 [Spirochaetia bacterium]